MALNAPVAAIRWAKHTDGARQQLQTMEHASSLESTAARVGKIQVVTAAEPAKGRAESALTADSVIVTVSLGVLQAKRIAFVPPLPAAAGTTES